MMIRQVASVNNKVRDAVSLFHEALASHVAPGVPSEREFFIDNLLVRIHLIIEMVLVDRPFAMGV